MGNHKRRKKNKRKETEGGITQRWPQGGAGPRKWEKEEEEAAEWAEWAEWAEQEPLSLSLSLSLSFFSSLLSFSLRGHTRWAPIASPPPPPPPSPPCGSLSQQNISQRPCHPVQIGLHHPLAPVRHHLQTNRALKETTTRRHGNRPTHLRRRKY